MYVLNAGYVSKIGKQPKISLEKSQYNYHKNGDEEQA